jgi:hypothetical protein
LRGRARVTLVLDGHRLASGFSPECVEIHLDTSLRAQPRDLG